MVSTNDLASEKRESDNIAAQAEAERISLEESRDVRFSQWVEVDYDKSLKTVYQRFKDGKTNPFSDMIIGGSNNEYTDFGSLLLDDSDTWKTSGYFKAVLSEGWMVQFNLLTENENYFTQSVDTALLDRLDFNDSPPGWWTEELDFSLFEAGDSVSIDIDNETTRVGQFTLVIGGVKYTVESPSKMDNEAKVWLRKVFYFNPNAGIVKFEGETSTDDDDLDGDDIDGDDGDDGDDGEDGGGGGGDGGDGGGGEDVEVEVSGFAMLAVLASVGAILFLALRRGA